MGTETPNPDMQWYLRLSRERGVTPRCPFATVEGCPRYYHSLALLGEAGSTKISPEEDERLKAFWKDSDLLPRTGEQETSLFGSNGKWKSYSEFCPEVIYNRFNLFASGLGDYFDSIDRSSAYTRLGQKKIPATNWRWQWEWVKPMHFTECPLYSPLSQRQESKTESTSGPPQKGNASEEELVTLKPGIWGMSVNLKEFARRIRTWWNRNS